MAETRPLNTGFCASALIARNMAVSPAKSKPSAKHPHAVLTSPVTIDATTVFALVPYFLRRYLRTEAKRIGGDVASGVQTRCECIQRCEKRQNGDHASDRAEDHEHVARRDNGERLAERLGRTRRYDYSLE